MPNLSHVDLLDQDGDRYDLEKIGADRLALHAPEAHATICIGKDQARELRGYLNEFIGDAKAVPGAAAALASQIPLNEALLRIAAVHDKTVGFRYAKGDGATIEFRRLKPEKVYVAKSGALSFVGYDPDRDDVRAYRVDRIKGDVALA